ncbi:uncharacterized protein C8R40DRAFT_1072685 [Lentinula edodes]|uniref:uncharacterized protein n=1 Tax=Lentinula edodes TaxID=5353 RepID=UPI001E8E9596|nr:uncharacterized protein C8R40DRAFT_1072685 [Lentinula edodes]KAH7871140.1 hypothetical protein C8R40DRAFT_1072685 [Lentinula edodes]
MAAGISSNLSRVDPSRSKSIDAMFEEFQAEVTKEADTLQKVNSMLSNKVSSGSSVVSNDSLEPLLVPDAQGRLQFGDPKKRNKRTTRALVTVSGLTQAIRKLEEKIQHMSPSHNMTEIHETLCVVEDGSEVLRHQISFVTRSAISEEVTKARGMLDALDQTTRKYFFDPVREMEVPPRRWSSVVGYVPQPTDENRLSLLDWTHLSPEHRAFRQTRLESLKLEITADSQKAPETLSKKKVLYRKIHKQKWNVILYICDNLAIFPDDRCPQHRASSKITKANVTKEQLTNILIEWRINGIQETDDFVWPFFTPKNVPPPVTPWARAPNDPIVTTRKLSLQECSELLTELSKSMNFTSALAIGNIHRVLQQPLARGEPEDELRKVLKKFPGDSLAFVCIDIERLPAGKFSKDDMVRQLMIWRMTKPLEQLNATDVDSSSLLQRIQQVVREVQTPTWVSNPPRNVGLPEATPSGTVTPVVTSGLVISNFRQPISKPAVATSRLLDLLGTNPYESLTRIPAPKGDYTIPIEDALGNSFICFRPEAKYQPGQEWLAGQIQHIFRRECNGSIQFAVYRSQPACVTDPFSDYWEDGFEAQIVSSKFSCDLEIVDLDQVAAHCARWAISDDLVVAVNLCSVRSHVVYCSFNVVNTFAGLISWSLLLLIARIIKITISVAVKTT